MFVPFWGCQSDVLAFQTTFHRPPPYPPTKPSSPNLLLIDVKSPELNLKYFCFPNPLHVCLWCTVWTLVGTFAPNLGWNSAHTTTSGCINSLYWEITHYNAEMVTYLYKTWGIIWASSVRHTRLKVSLRSLKIINIFYRYFYIRKRNTLKAYLRKIAWEFKSKNFKVWFVILELFPALNELGNNTSNNSVTLCSLLFFLSEILWCRTTRY